MFYYMYVHTHCINNEACLFWSSFDSTNDVFWKTVVCPQQFPCNQTPVMCTYCTVCTVLYMKSVHIVQCVLCCTCDLNILYSIYCQGKILRNFSGCPMLIQVVQAKMFAKVE